VEIIYADECYRIMGACFEVYREVGSGFLEAVYQECLGIELAERGVTFAAQAELRLTYKDRKLAQKYYADFVCLDKIILEIKAVKELDDVHRAQVHNDLKATGLKLGLLVNFGHYPLLEHERIVR
jgi:GxxExxY protein